MLGLYYYSNSYKYYEQMENKSDKPITHSNARCPNMLIEKDGGIIYIIQN